MSNLDIQQDFFTNHAAPIHVNNSIPALVETALAKKEGILTSTGALKVDTGKYTGRSPNDKFVVQSPNIQDKIWWENNAPISEADFFSLYDKMKTYLKEKELYVCQGFAGADQEYTLPVRIINELAWQNIFVQQLFLRPHDTNWQFSANDALTIICAPNFKASPSIDHTNSEAFIILNFEQKIILIGGSHYAGEIKKSVFTFLNYLLPQKNIFSMHCAANKNNKNEVALFFGLSGTGKTTLSADPVLSLLGDDEHGWCDKGVFNFEGGCYAKCIRLSQENEPQIWDAIKFGAILENVVLDENRLPDFNSDKLTENTRAAYPVSFIPNCIYPGVGGHPKTVIFLTADAFGVLPPIAKLTPEQAMYYFLSGYTSKLAGTERGITEPEATFSSCFGQPFLPLHPLVYANLLQERLNKHNANVYLVNTGWHGGSYGIGKRISIKYTRLMVAAAINGDLNNVPYNQHSVFNLSMPAKCDGIPDEILNPKDCWQDKDLYKQTAEKLALMFKNNFKKFSNMPSEVITAGPK